MFRPVPILMYHQIDVSPPRGAGVRGICVTRQAFHRQMWLLDAMGYKGLSMSALSSHLRGETSGKVVGITFDDGYQDNLDNALPVLAEFGFSATCYVVGGLVGKSNEWDAHRGGPAKPLMTWESLNTWIRCGMEVGAHSLTHASLPHLPHADAKREIFGSKAVIENRLGIAVDHFAYPYGDADAQVRELVQLAGYKTATGTIRGRATPAHCAYALPRVSVSKSTHLLRFWQKIATRYEDKRGQSLDLMDDVLLPR